MGHFKIAAVPLGLGVVVLLFALGTTPAAAGQYVVQPGDTLWGISQSHHLDVNRLISLNDFSNPNLIRPGDRVTLPDPPAAPAPAPAATPSRRSTTRTVRWPPTTRARPRPASTASTPQAVTTWTASGRSGTASSSTGRNRPAS